MPRSLHPSSGPDIAMRQLSSILFLFILVATASASSDSGLRDAYGRSLLTIDGDILVGETSGFSTPGMIHVLRKNDRGSWDVIQTIQSSDAEVGDSFGQQMLYSEGALIVTSPGALDGLGAVYVFERNQSGMWQQATRITTDVAQGDQFAASLAASGDHILVGAPGVADGTGSVFVFSVEMDWTEVKVLKSPVAEVGALFGSSIAADDSHVAVGSPGFDESNGRVDLFNILDWSTAGIIVSPDGETEYRLGTGLYFYSDQLLASNPRANRGAGMVSVFKQKGDTWEHQKDLTSGSEESGSAFFGASIAASADEIWISAPLANGFKGIVYRYSSRNFKPLGSVANHTEGGRSGFGQSLMVGEAVAAVGMPGHDYGLGSTVVYEKDSEGSWQKIGMYHRPGADLPMLSGAEIECKDGLAHGYSCQNVDLVSFIPLKDLHMNRGVRLNDIWGWTDEETGKEYGIVGHMEAAVFVDVSNPVEPVVLGEIRRTEGSPGSTWRDMKVFKDHVFIVADGAGQHGMQVFDLRRLRDWPGEFQDYEPDFLYTGIASSHNIVINENTGYAYTVGNSSGGETCGGALHMIDINDPLNPIFVGCFNDPQTGNQGSGSTHDAQCVTYHGPDREHQGKEICVGSNGTAISIADVSDKDHPLAISQGTYPNSAYVHQGWFTDDHRYFYQNDEGDELNGMAENTRTMIWDLTDLDEPEMIAEYFGDSNSTDHNLYVKGDFMYQTNNASGLRVIDIRDRANPVEVGYFDTTPNGKNVAGFDGTWSSFPYFDSGTILVNSRREGLFIVRKREIDT